MRCKDKCKWIKLPLSEFACQQAVLSQPQADQDNVTQASFVVLRKLIAKKLKPHAEGEFVEHLAAAVELRTAEKNELFQSVSLSQRTVSD